MWTSYFKSSLIIFKKENGIEMKREKIIDMILKI